MAREGRYIHHGMLIEIYPRSNIVDSSTIQYNKVVTQSKCTNETGTTGSDPSNTEATEIAATLIYGPLPRYEAVMQA